MDESTPLITNDAVVFGLLIAILGFIFTTESSQHAFWKKFYTYVPALLLCYFLPSLFNSLGIISGAYSNLYFVVSRYLLPTSLVLLTLSTDFKAITKLGSKALIMFLAGTVGILLGGPLSILFFSYVAPSVVGADSETIWRGMTTVAGSWIGGGANQAAMKEVFLVDDVIFSKMVTVDILVSNAWLALLLIGVGKSKKIDAYFKADASLIDRVKEKMETFQSQIVKIPTLTDLIKILAIGFGITGLSHLMSDLIVPFVSLHFPNAAKYSLTSNFFWIIILATTMGLAMSFTRHRKLEGAGASRIGSLFIYILVATIGMEMDIWAITESPGIFLVLIVWMFFHIAILLIVAKLIKAPFFFVAVGSQANVGGAASAPIIAAAFHPSLAPVGVLLAVLGYALGTYAAYFCGLLMQMASSTL